MRFSVFDRIVVVVVVVVFFFFCGFADEFSRFLRFLTDPLTDSCFAN